MLDLAKLEAQFVGLERRTARSGKDSIDHGPGGHDDVSNVCAGAVLMVLGHVPMQIAPETMATILSARPYRPEFSERQMGRS